MFPAERAGGLHGTRVQCPGPNNPLAWHSPTPGALTPEGEQVSLAPHPWGGEGKAWRGHLAQPSCTGPSVLIPAARLGVVVGSIWLCPNRAWWKLGTSWLQQGVPVQPSPPLGWGRWEPRPCALQPLGGGHTSVITWSLIAGEGSPQLSPRPQGWVPRSCRSCHREREMPQLPPGERLPPGPVRCQCTPGNTMRWHHEPGGTAGIGVP